MKSGGSEIQFGNSLVSSETRLLLDFLDCLGWGPHPQGLGWLSQPSHLSSRQWDEMGGSTSLTRLGKKKKKKSPEFEGWGDEGEGQ